MSSGFSFSCVCLKAEPVYTGETGHYTIYNFSLNIPTGPWQMRSNKNRTEQIPRILSPVLFCFFFLSTSQCVWLNCWTCWVALGPFPFTLYVPPEEEEEPPHLLFYFFPRIACLYMPTTGSTWMASYLSRRTQCCWRVNALIDINLGHIVVGRLCLCVYTLLYSGVEKKKRLFDMERRHTYYTQRAEYSQRKWL